MIKIVTDTASDITLEQAKKMDITLLTLPVSFGETPYDQLADENFTQFYDMLERSKVLPVTSLASPGAYKEIFDNAKRNHDSVIVIPISSQLSGSWQSAHLAKEMTDYDDIHIVDARQALIGQRILVEYAVRLRNEGQNADNIAARVLEASGRIRLYGALDTLKYLIKGGRISKSAGMVGSALNIKPIVCLQNGVVCMAGKAKGNKGAIKTLLHYISENTNFDPDFPFCFGYTKSSEQLDVFSQLATKKFNLHGSVVYPVGGVIGTHVGPNAIVAVWVVKN